MPTTAAAEYNPTVYARQGDLGSHVLKPRPSGTVWRRGTVAYVRQQATAPHGGGYIFRLCPANETLSEECFNRIKLEFAFPDKHTLRFADEKLDRDVKATVVTEGGGKGWTTAGSQVAPQSEDLAMLMVRFFVGYWPFGAQMPHTSRLCVRRRAV